MRTVGGRLLCRAPNGIEQAPVSEGGGREGVDRDVGRYDALRDRLRQLRGASEVTLTFDDIEGLLGDALPASAREHRGWWANEMRPDSRHVQCRAWMETGWFVERVDLHEGRVTFVESSQAVPDE